MKKLFSIIIVILFSLGFSKISLAENSEIFNDVPTSHPSYKAIEYLNQHYIVKGYEDGTFRPEATINRAEALKIIILSANYHLDKDTLQKLEKIQIKIPTGTTENEIENSGFKDVNTEDWFYPYIMKAAELKLISGYSDGTFKPENPVNFAESLKLIILGNEAPLPEIQGDPFADVAWSSWYAPYFQYYKNYKLLSGDESENINPGEFITRGKLCELIYRYIKREEIKETGIIETHDYIFGKATFYGEGDGFDGKNTASGEVFDKNKMTAAHRTLPFGTKIRVYSIDNDKSVEVTINDRGPYDYRFILDLSAAAFEELAPISRGFIDIKFEIIN